MPVDNKSEVTVYFQDTGTGALLLVIPGGGLHAAIPYLSEQLPVNPVQLQSDAYHCITRDLRNANSGRSSGPLDVGRPVHLESVEALG